MSENAGMKHADAERERPDGPYWEDRVYRHLSREHRDALTAANAPEVARLDGLMQDLVNDTMSDDLYHELADEARASRKKRQHARKHKGRPANLSQTDSSSSINVADLKRRVFSPNVSRENVIKALEALPKAERKATIAALPPGLRRKLGDYLDKK